MSSCPSNPPYCNNKQVDLTLLCPWSFCWGLSSWNSTVAVTQHSKEQQGLTLEELDEMMPHSLAGCGTQAQPKYPWACFSPPLGPRALPTLELHQLLGAHPPPPWHLAISLLWNIVNWFLFPSPGQKHERSFLQYFLWESAWASGSQSHNIVGSSYDWVSLEFLTLRVVHTEPPEIHQLQFTFSYCSSGSCGVFYLWISSGKPWLLVFASLCLLFLWAAVFSMSSPLLQTQEELLIFQSVHRFTCC